MQRIFVNLIIFLSSAIYQPLASASVNSTTIQQVINQIIQNFGQDVNIGIVVQSMNNGKILYQRSSTLAFNPASSTKLFTAVAALSYLGPNYTFTTQLATDAKNVYIKFTGDPELTTQDLNDLISALAQKGIHTINGNLILDDTALDRANWASGWMWDEEQICYAAPATAVILDHNCFDVNMLPGERINGTPKLEFAPNFVGATINNQAITKTAEKWECPLELQFAGKNHYVLTGCVPPSKNAQPLQIALNDPPLAAANTLVALLKQHGITLKGNVIYGRMPANAIVLASHNSPPLSEIITYMLKKSDNLMADVIFKTLGAHYFNTTGTWANGAAALRAILTPKTGIDFDKLNIVDGAGLSRYDLINPHQFIKLLNYAYRSMPANTIFYQALPIAGVDGTLENRFKNTPYAGRIHAKTGSMESTSSLVGYVKTNSKQTLAFAILINGFVGKQHNYHVLEDEICKLLMQS